MLRSLSVINPVGYAPFLLCDFCMYRTSVPDQLIFSFSIHRGACAFLFYSPFFTIVCPPFFRLTDGHGILYFVCLFLGGSIFHCSNILLPKICCSLTKMVRRSIIKNLFLLPIKHYSRRICVLPPGHRSLPSQFSKHIF